MRVSCDSRQQLGDHDLVLIQAVILNLEEEILLAEHVGVAVRQPLGFLVAIGHDRLVDVAAQAGRHRDQALGMLRQQILVDARLVVEAFEKRGGDQLQQVAIAFLVLAQQHQVVVAIGIAAACQALLRDVDFASDHRMHALLLWPCCKTRLRQKDCRGPSWRRRASSAPPPDPSTARFRRRRRAASNRCGNVDERRAVRNSLRLLLRGEG